LGRDPACFAEAAGARLNANATAIAPVVHLCRIMTAPLPETLRRLGKSNAAAIEDGGIPPVFALFYAPWEVRRVLFPGQRRPVLGTALSRPGEGPTALRHL